jgi:hypothetical protein
VAGEGEAGIIYYALVQRRSHHGINAALEAACHGILEQREYIRCIGRIEVSWAALSGQGMIRNHEVPGAVWRNRAAIEGSDGNVCVEMPGALGEEIQVSRDQQPHRQRVRGQCDAKIGPDPGRFAGRDDNAWKRHVFAPL